MSVLGNYITTPNLYDVPPAYQKVEYLSAPGSSSYNSIGQYIILPTAVTTDQIAKGSFKFNNLASGTSGKYASVFGGSLAENAVDGLTSPAALKYVCATDTSYEGFSYGSTRTRVTDIVSGNIYTFDFEVEPGQQKYTINGTTITGSLTSGVEGSATMWMFACRYLNGDPAYNNTLWRPLYYLKGDIYFLRLWNASGKKLLDCVPCYRKSDNKPGMYELVSRQFLTNSGNGEFTAGPNV